MARTTFVNPFSNPRRKRRKSRGRRRHKRAYSRAPRRRVHHRRSRRRNAGIAPFIQNPLILSNPARRRRHRRNPGLGIPSLSKLLNGLLTSGGGAAAALAVNTVALNKIPNAWLRRAAQAGAAVIGGSMLGSRSAALGGAYAGAQMYPLVQDLAADLLGVNSAGAVAATEADIDALAADLEDVLDESEDDDDSDYEDGDEEDAW